MIKLPLGWQIEEADSLRWEMLVAFALLVGAAGIAESWWLRAVIIAVSLPVYFSISSRIVRRSR